VSVAKTALSGTESSNGVLYGLDVQAAQRGGDWYALALPGAYVEYGAETWDLSYPVQQSVGNVSGIVEVDLRHPREPQWPVFAYDASGPIRTVGSVTVSTSVTLKAEDTGWYVAYLPDVGPYQSFNLVVDGATLASNAYTIHNNRVASSLATLASASATATYVVTGIAHAGLTSVTITGTYTSLTLEYRTYMPCGTALSSYTLTGWTCTGTISGTSVTQASTQLCYYEFSSGLTESREYVLSAEVEITVGQVRLGANGQGSILSGDHGRQQLIIPVSGSLFTIYLKPATDLAVYSLHGIYLTESVDPDHRTTVGKIADECYVTNIPYASIAGAMVGIDSNALSHELFGTVRAPSRLKVAISGISEGRTSPYFGTVTASASAAASIVLEESGMPGIYWYTVDTGVTSQTITVGTGAVTSQYYLDTSIRMPDYHLDSTFICPYLEVTTYSEPEVYTLHPRIRDQWGEVIIVSSATFSTPVTVHVTNGQLVEGSISSEGSELVISSASICTALGGTRAYIELNYNGSIFRSPPVQLPPEQTIGQVVSLDTGIAALPFIVDLSTIDDPASGRVFIP